MASGLRGAASPSQDRRAHSRSTVPCELERSSQIRFVLPTPKWCRGALIWRRGCTSDRRSYAARSRPTRSASTFSRSAASTPRTSSSRRLRRRFVDGARPFRRISSSRSSRVRTSASSTDGSVRGRARDDARDRDRSRSRLLIVPTPADVTPSKLWRDRFATSSIAFHVTLRRRLGAERLVGARGRGGAGAERGESSCPSIPRETSFRSVPSRSPGCVRSAGHARTARRRSRRSRSDRRFVAMPTSSSRPKARSRKAKTLRRLIRSLGSRKTGGADAPGSSARRAARVRRRRRAGRVMALRKARAAVASPPRSKRPPRSFSARATLSTLSSLACLPPARSLLASFSGPVQILVGGAGAGLLAIDGRVRQPGIGAPRPRGFMSAEEIPDAARVGVPWLPATLSVAIATMGTATFNQVVAPAVASRRERRAPRSSRESPLAARARSRSARSVASSSRSRGVRAVVSSRPKISRRLGPTSKRPPAISVRRVDATEGRRLGARAKREATSRWCSRFPWTHSNPTSRAARAGCRRRARPRSCRGRPQRDVCGRLLGRGDRRPPPPRPRLPRAVLRRARSARADPRTSGRYSRRRQGRSRSSGRRRARARALRLWRRATPTPCSRQAIEACHRRRSHREPRRSPSRRALPRERHRVRPARLGPTTYA